MQENIIPHTFQVSRENRISSKGHSSFVLWFTGLSGSGKSTVASAVEKALHDSGIHTYLLDGDSVRNGINKDLTFSQEDRKENLRRIGEIAKLFIDAGVVVLAAFVSPYKMDRLMVRNTVEDSNFVEIFVNTPLEVCEERDVKNLYAKARKGLIKDFTGVNAPYEEPEQPDIKIDTSVMSLDDSVKKIISEIKFKLQVS